MADGRLSLNKLHDIMKEGFSTLENSLTNMNKNQKKITDDIEEMKNEIIKNLVEQNKKLQKEVKYLENELENQKKNFWN